MSLDNIFWDLLFLASWLPLFDLRKSMVYEEIPQIDEIMGFLSSSAI
jgi:hypothetical protein